MLAAEEILSTLKGLGITAWVEGDKLIVEPGELVPVDMVPAIRERKAELLTLIGQSRKPTNPCVCYQLPSVNDVGHLAHAGCGPDYIRCEDCGKVWECKICNGCRYCRTPG